jgi:hypothetical protein
MFSHWFVVAVKSVRQVWEKRFYKSSRLRGR